MKVFIADSSPAIRERLDSLLSEIAGIEIAGHAGNVEEARALIHDCNPDVVIMDSSLPGGGGIGLLRTLKADGSNPVVIVITSFPTLQYRMKFHEAGAAYFFDKSRDQDRLVEALIALKEELAR